MVLVTKILLKNVKRASRKYIRGGGFMDSLRLFVKAGSGGNGLPKFGGIGGQGGNVSLIAKENLTLEKVVSSHSTKRIAAKHGRDSTHNFILGVSGDSVQVEVPVGITVITEDGKKMGELNLEGAELVVAKGGLGGHPKNGFLGKHGQSYSIKLDLKLISDIGLVGFPNAGKSTLLKAISHAKPKIASYPFTTIRPNIGIVKYNDYRQMSIADLPGLIEGAHANQGMGHKFLKHIERTKMMLLVADINGFQLSPQYTRRSCLDTIVLLNKELELYNPLLLNTPSMIVINKMDTEGAWDKFHEIKDQIFNISDAFESYPDELRPEKPLKFHNVLPISAKDGEGIEKLKEKLRVMLDIFYDENSEENVNLFQSITNSQKERGPVLV